MPPIRAKNLLAKSNEPANTKPTERTKPRRRHSPHVDLIKALTKLSAACSNSNLFADLHERRTRTRQVYANLIAIHQHDAARRANAKIAEGGTVGESLTEFAHADQMVTERPPSNEPMSLKRSLHRVVTDAESALNATLTHVRNGGAAQLDAAFAPGSSRHAVIIEAKAMESLAFLSLVHMSIEDERESTAVVASKLKDLGTWTEGLTSQLAASINHSSRGTGSSNSSTAEIARNLVRISDVTKIIGGRSDSLKRKIKGRKYHIFGTKGFYSAEWEQILETVSPGKRRLLRQWEENGFRTP